VAVRATHAARRRDMLLVQSGMSPARTAIR